MPKGGALSLSHTPAVTTSETTAAVPVDRGTEAYEKLRELIAWGRLAPGTRIVERDLASRLEISRTPIRSALQRLQQEGYVVSADNGKQARLSVAPLTVEDARELFGIVAAVEGLAGYLAAQLPARSRMTLVQLLRRLNADLQNAAGGRQPDPSRIFEVDRDFHRCYVEAAAGPRLLGLHDAIKPQAERYNRLYTTALVGEIHTSVQEHEEIIQGIAGGHPDQAERAVRTNFRNAAERLTEVIVTLGERGSW
ncbi:GntR family transcriptional regulator [soil metagenome]|jgi:DNA-binding GntR family transcriptional regulator